MTARSLGTGARAATAMVAARRTIVLLAVMLVPVSLVPPSASATARVAFLVDAPASTPAGATLWISGSVPELGSWNGAGLKLEPREGGYHAGSVVIADGTGVEFKVTRGSWETVEKSAGGGEIANRTLVAGAEDTVRIRVEAWRDQVEKARPSTNTGVIDRHAAFASKHVKPRDVLVYLPPGYATDTTARYPVLYFHDGNNVFDEATSFAGVEWGVDEAAERLIAAGDLPPFIAVAVCNTAERIDEYTPAADLGRKQGGRAGDYARFLLEELMPFVERTYRVRTEPQATGVIGSSLGGILSLYLGLEHSDQFGLVGCVSPATWWANRDIVRRASRPGLPLRIWLDIGTAEGENSDQSARQVEDARMLKKALARSGGYREGRQFHYEEVVGAAHHERAWAGRIDRILRFLLAPPRGATGRTSRAKRR